MIIDGTDFKALECQKYWSFTSSFKGDKKAEIRNMIFSGNYLGSRKRDGALYKFVKDDDGNMGLFGRSKGVNDDYSEKLAWVPHLHQFFDYLPNGTCLLGELYLPSNEKSTGTTTIMGCLLEKAIERQEQEEPLTYYIFDVLAYGSESLLMARAEERFAFLNKIKIDYPNLEWAQYYTGQELWDSLARTLDEGGEGVVITKKDSTYQPGKRPAKQTLKIKKEIQDNIDCVIVGANPPTKDYTGSKEIEKWNYWQNVKTGEKLEGQLYRAYFEGETLTPITKMYYLGGAGSLILGAYKGNKLVQIGNLSGLTDEVLINWRDYVGKVCEVSAMEILPTLGLRHPRFIRWRDDKPAIDCSYESIYGE